MKNPPQKLTLRYCRNLLANGENRHFTVQGLTRLPAEVDGIFIGYYYLVALTDYSSKRYEGVGTTPAIAVRRTLEKAGVTFK